MRVKARRAVLLTCGGFEAAPEMLEQYFEAKPIFNSVFQGNTGDGIRMAQELGAELWHMWSMHGSYGWLHTDPKYKMAIRTARFPDWNTAKPFPTSSSMREWPRVSLGPGGQAGQTLYERIPRLPARHLPSAHVLL